MRQSQLFTKTKKEAPKDAEVISHKLLVRADFIEQLASGIYIFLPLGLRVQKRIENVIREELENIGAQELSMPALQPKSIWEKTKRWNDMDPPLFKLEDRHKRELALGSTHEEVITYTASKRIRNFNDLPLALFQIQTKFRNEMRATGGILRTREFLMKDLYSFHRDQKDFEKYYELLKRVYLKIFQRCGLQTIITEASGTSFTKEYTHEFQVITPAGEDTIIFCPKEHFSQNKEIAKLKEGAKCPICGHVLKSAKSVEVGNIFPLGDKYSKAFDAYFIDKDGKKKPIIMGCYGIGIDRVIATIVEVHHDEKGIIWPREVAPFDVHLISVGNTSRIKKAAEKICRDLSSFAPQKRSYGGSTVAFGVGGQKKGVEVLYDDRAKSPGEKFADADLIGIPVRLVVSERTLAKDSVEVKKRSDKKIKLVKLNLLNSTGYVR